MFYVLRFACTVCVCLLLLLFFSLFRLIAHIEIQFIYSYERVSTRARARPPYYWYPISPFSLRNIQMNSINFTSHTNSGQKPHFFSLSVFSLKLISKVYCSIYVMVKIQFHVSEERKSVWVSECMRIKSFLLVPLLSPLSSPVAWQFLLSGLFHHNENILQAKHTK